MIKKLLCKLGWHDWVYYGRMFLSGVTDIKYPPTVRYRECIRCCETQRLDFYINRTQEWVTVKDLKQIK